jgi:nucleolar pre-ribosomal-associated protein 2
MSAMQKSRLNTISAEFEEMAELKMPLQTESAQAARILKGWLIAVSKILVISTMRGTVLSEACLGLSPVLEIWDLRVTDDEKDEAGSTEQFSAECLIPLLILYNQLQLGATLFTTQSTITALRSAARRLEGLLAHHIFAPSKAAFLKDAVSQSNAQTDFGSLKAVYLSSNLEPLRAKILQAAQIQDMLEPLPAFFLPLFDSIPRLLDMIISKSPSRTPKAMIAEQPWIQAAFIALAECAGCSLEPPEFPIPKASVSALERTIDVLALHTAKLDSSILSKVFWFHSGVKYPLKQNRTIHWSLIAALIRLDPDIFATPSSTPGNPSQDGPDDLAAFLFDQITSFPTDAEYPLNDDKMDIDGEKHSHSLSSSQENTLTVSVESKEPSILQSIILPIMNAFARSRDLLGFLRRWDAQLCAIPPVSRVASNNLDSSIWESQDLGLELAKLLEQSLTLTQIIDIYREHSKRVRADKHSDNNEAIQKAFSSSVLLRGLLASTKSDETIEALAPHFRSLLTSYTTLVTDNWHRNRIDLSSCWITLSRIVVISWPLQLHGSKDVQMELIHPLVKQASKDVSATRKGQDEASINSEVRAAAMMFILTSSDLLRTVPGWDHLLRENLRKVLKTFSSDRLEPKDLEQMLNIFCLEYAQLLEFLEPDTCQKSLLKLLAKIAELDQGIGQHIAGALSESIFSSASLTVCDAYTSAALDAIDQFDAHLALVHIRPATLSRERREAVLDKLTARIISKSDDVELLLSIMNVLQQVPNVTAKISDSNALFDIAQGLHDNNAETPPILLLFQNLVQQTLNHILPNKDQVQNKKYLEKFQKKLISITKKASRCFPAKLAIIRAVVLLQKDELVSWEQYSEFLRAYFDASADSKNLVLDAFSEIPLEYFKQHAGSFDAAGAIVRDWITMHLDIATPLTFQEGPAAWTTHDWARVHALLTKYRIYPNNNWFMEVSLRLLLRFKGQQHHKELQISALKAVKENLASLSLEQKLNLLPLLFAQDGDQAKNAAYQLLHVLVSTLDDNVEEEVELRRQQLSILPAICDLIVKSPTAFTFSTLLDSIDTIIRDKPAYVTQRIIENVTAALDTIASRHSPELPSSDAPLIFTRLCKTSRYILLLHRSRLGGRFHHLLQLLQNLLLCLFIPNSGRGDVLPAWLKSTASLERTHLTPANASNYARILSTLCSPTQSSVSRTHRSNNTKSTLNDPVKAAREYASHFIYPLLGAFCRFQLNGRLLPEVRDKLMPGLWEAVGVASLDNDALQGMFAGLDRSSKDIWKGTWEDYSRSHGRAKAN